MTLIASLLQRLWPSDGPDTRILLAGLDCAGKTTLLYKLKLRSAEVFTTIPTIGFNVETVDVPAITAPGRRKAPPTPMRMTCWDVGGCDKIRPLIQHYTKGTDGLVWCVDSADRERMEESVTEMRQMLLAFEEEEAQSGRLVPVLILANKQDLAPVLSASEVAAYFKNVCKSRLCNVFPTSLVRPIESTGLPVAFDWFASALNAVKAGLSTSTHHSTTTKSTTKEALSATPSKETLQSRLENYLSRAVADVDEDTFLKQFRDFELPSWDHYTHIRVAYVILTKFGRQKEKDMIFEGIERYIANSKQTTGRTFHVTMTYFWIQIVHFAIRSTRPASPSVPPSFSSSPLSSLTSSTAWTSPSMEAINSDELDTATETGTDSEAEEISRFLLLNPYVVDGNLWAEYYTKDVMMSPQAKAMMVLPDVKPLPSIVVRDVVRD